MEVPVLDLAELLDRLCSVTPDRHPGSAGIQEAMDLVCGLLADLGWQVEAQQVPVVCWEGGAGQLTIGRRFWPIEPSPYSQT